MKIAADVFWILWTGATAGSAQTLRIALYDYSGMSARGTERLVATADAVFAHSGIHLVWLHCRGIGAPANESGCSEKMQPNEMAVRIQPAGPPSVDSSGAPLGRSFVTAAGGSYATVFVRAVQALAARFGVPFDLLLGYAVAHEAGHCILGPGHSYAGLMRPSWNRKDAGEISRLGLHLTKQEAREAVVRLKLAELSKGL